MKESSHSLVSLTTYLNKGFALRLHARQMWDAGPDPAISAASVFLALRHALVFRLPSFQQRDAERAHSYGHPGSAPSAPSGTTPWATVGAASTWNRSSGCWSM